MNETSELLMKLADALDAASALARKIAERQPTRVELKLDGQTFAQAVIGTIHYNPVEPRTSAPRGATGRHP